MPALHPEASDVGTSIIGTIEVVESDLATGLAKTELQVEDAPYVYDGTPQGNRATNTTKDQDLKYKTGEVEGVAKAAADMRSEQASVRNFSCPQRKRSMPSEGSLHCKDEKYDERKAHREGGINCWQMD